MTQGLENGADSGLQRGLNGQVVFDGQDITKNGWTHQVGTLGEYLSVFTDAGSAVANWTKTAPTNAPLTWYKLLMKTPEPVGDPAYATWQFDMSAMGKGELWCNGFMLGAYWSIKDGSGHYSQQFYHLPRDYLNPVGEDNLVVLLEETGGTPGSIVLQQRNYRPIAARSEHFGSQKNGQKATLVKKSE